jgi:hypothetical protein
MLGECKGVLDRVCDGGGKDCCLIIVRWAVVLNVGVMYEICDYFETSGINMILENGVFKIEVGWVMLNVM